MKKLSIALLAVAFLTSASLVSFAAGNGESPLTGTYEGTISSKTFFVNDGSAAKVKSQNEYEIDLLFNGTVFILQSKNLKAMGTYTVTDDVVTFEVESVKGSESLARSILEQEYRFSTSGDRLMLINKNNSEALITYQLEKSNS